jgi:hypothetical protein
MLLKLITIKTSHKKDKKFDAVFERNGRTKVISFGSAGYRDFTKPPHDEKRKELYIQRHQKNEDWTKPDTAGALSRFVLWNKPSLNESIKDYKKRFNL